MQRPDASDSFFNSFDQSSPLRHQNRGQPPSGPPPPAAMSGRGPPPGPPPFRPPQRQPQPQQHQQQQPPSNSYVLSSSNNINNSGHHQQQTTGQPAGQPTSYYGAPPSPQQQPYGMQQQQQQQQSNNDWYTPSPPVASRTNFPGENTVPQPMMVMAPPVYNPHLEGTMDTSGRSTGSYAVQGLMQPQTFIPGLPSSQQAAPVHHHLQAPAATWNDDGFSYGEDEAPLLEELGVNVEHILMKTKAVVIPFRRFHKHSALADPSIIVEDADLAGPLAFALLLGGELLITGKLQFGYIYGFGLFGCLAMTLILNLMSPTAVSFWTVTSILGYSLLPVNILAALKIILFSFGTVTQCLAILTVLWSTTASTRLLEVGCGLADQRYLLAYPIALLYSAFVLITIF